MLLRATLLCVPSVVLRLALASVLALLMSHASAAEEVLRSPNDARIYRALVLDNEMKVILISDPETDLAAASLSVDVGSNANPSGREGLAHFLEHMLFLGTGKYPQPGEYKDYITRHGGSDNAYTAQDETNYFFEIKASKLEGALDRFAQFFIDPLFNAEYVERERQVVQSEYLGRKKSDGRRTYSATRQVLNPAHPASRFSVGNLTTLGDRTDSNIRDELIAFYDRYYSANRMALTVFGAEPLDVLEQWVRTRFSQVSNTQVAKPIPEVALFERGTLPARLDVVPVKEQRSLSLTFPIPPVRDHWREKPTAHLAHLIGHEGEGSLLVALKELGWAQALSAGPGYSDERAATFNIGVQLTPAGLSHIDDIIALTFRYIDLIAREGIEQWVFDENRRLGEIAFRFQEKAGPLALARALATAQHDLPQSEVIRGRYAFDRFDPALIRRFLAHLTADNMLVTVVAPGLDADRTTRWYDAPYRIRALDDAALARFESGKTDAVLAMPAPNPFIPDNLALLPEPATTRIPMVRTRKNGFTLWHQADTTFGVPRAAFYFSLRSPLANVSPRQRLLSALYVDLVNDALDSFAYPADLAGLGFSFYTHMRGYTVRISGYDQRQGEMLERILSAMTSREVDERRFAIHRAEIKRRLINARRDQPYGQAMRRLRGLVVEPHWSVAERLAVIDSLTPTQLREFIDRMLARVNVVALAHGNVSTAQAKALGEKVYDALVAPAETVDVPRARVRRLRRGDRLALDITVDHPESAAVMYLQGADKDIRTRAHAGMLSQVLSSPFFDRLRTERKLGYVVFANAYPVLDTAGLVFIAQSPIVTSATLVDEMRSFLEDYRDRLRELTVGELDDHKRALIARVMEEERQLTERTDRYWNEIDRESYEFDTREKLVQAIRDASVSSLASFYDEVVLESTRRQLVVGARGEKRGPSVAPAGSITAEALRDSRSLFPG